MASAAAAVDGGWSTVGPKRRRAKVIKGNTEWSGRFRGAPEPEREIFLYRVSQECEPEDIQTVLQENNCYAKKIEKKSNDEAKFRSFKLTVSQPDATAMLSDSFPWPTGVRVRRYFQRRRDAKEEETSQL